MELRIEVPGGGGWGRSRGQERGDSYPVPRAPRAPRVPLDTESAPGGDGSVRPWEWAQWGLAVAVALQIRGVFWPG